MSKKKLAKVFYADLWGKRKDDKYPYLFNNDINTTKWQEIKPVEPYYFFVPKDFALQEEYDKFWKITNIFREYQIGLMTGQDKFFIDSNQQTLKTRILSLFNKNLNNDDLRYLYNLNSQAGEKTIRSRNISTFNKDFIQPYCYRAFDTRYIYLENKFLWRSVEALNKQFAFKNIALVTTRILANPPFNHVFIVENVGDNTLISNKTKERNYFFTLYLYFEESKGLFIAKEQADLKQMNFTPEFLLSLKETISSEKTPEEIFFYIYAVLYSPTYRKRYEEFLKIDFPRIPLPSNLEYFQEMSNLGSELAALHLLKHPSLSKTEVGFPKGGSKTVEKIKYDEENKRVYINKEQYFENIEVEVWKYRIGAYQVMEKYLKDRKKRKLSLDEINHYMKVEKAIKLTIQIQGKIDEIFCK